MKDKVAEQFLEQFDASRRQLATWHPWIKESAKVATASLPSVNKTTPCNLGGTTQQEKQIKN